MQQFSDKTQANSAKLSMTMKKAILIIVAIAILGAVGIYSRSNKAEDNTTSLKTQSSTASSSAVAQSVSTSNSNRASGYKNGIFTGTTEDTPYGPVQIAVVINGGRISDVNFLQMPSDMGHSIEITRQSEPLLKQSTIELQSSKIDFVSGATSTSYGYQASLQHALDQAKVS